MLKIQHVQMNFKNRTIIKDATLSLRSGDIIHITGPNGCGKSTLFKIIVGIYQPTSGKVSLDADDQLGALIENPGFLEFEDLKTNLKFLANLKNHFDEQYTSELCLNLGLDFENHQHLSKYSVGMRQKAGIIQTIMEGQNIVLLDEPTRDLDAEALQTFVKLINALQRQGCGIMIASHDLVRGINYTQHYIFNNGIVQKND